MDALHGRLQALIAAAKRADWMQVVLNQGPPCFHLEGKGIFCLRAQRWAGHGAGEYPMHEFISLAVLLEAILDALRASPRQEWRPIKTCPKMRTVLLFAVSDVAPDGRVLNWKKATGSWHTSYEDERSEAEGYTPWRWDGHQLRDYELQPTHWMPLPASPQPQESAPPAIEAVAALGRIIVQSQHIGAIFDDGAEVVSGARKIYEDAYIVLRAWPNVAPEPVGSPSPQETL